MGKKGRIVLPTMGVRPEAAADQDLESDLAVIVALHDQADVVDTHGGAIARAPVTAILNLRGRNENSGCRVDHWRMISQQTRGSSISSGGGAGILVGGGVADAVAAGLDGVHLDLGELRQDIGHSASRAS